MQYCTPSKGIWTELAGVGGGDFKPSAPDAARGNWGENAIPTVDRINKARSERSIFSFGETNFLKASTIASAVAT